MVSHGFSMSIRTVKPPIPLFLSSRTVRLKNLSYHEILPRKINLYTWCFLISKCHFLDSPGLDLFHQWYHQLSHSGLAESRARRSQTPPLPGHSSPAKHPGRGQRGLRASSDLDPNQPVGIPRSRETNKSSRSSQQPSPFAKRQKWAGNSKISRRGAEWWSTVDEPTGSDAGGNSNVPGESVWRYFAFEEPSKNERQRQFSRCGWNNPWNALSQWRNSPLTLYCQKILAVHGTESHGFVHLFCCCCLVWLLVQSVLSYLLGHATQLQLECVILARNCRDSDRCT